MAVTRERAFLGLGGNIGDPRTAMAAALRDLDADAEIAVLRVSSLYRTPPWGKTDQPDFLNAVAEVETGLAPRALLERCLAAEAALKRVRAERWGPRLIDIDILAYGTRRIDEPGLAVPHPRMAERAFVLVPLAELAPEMDVEGERAGQRAARAGTGGMSVVARPQDWWAPRRR